MLFVVASDREEEFDKKGRRREKDKTDVF